MRCLFASGTQNHWSFSFSISPSNEYSGLISFRIDWFDFLDVQGTLKSLLQHHNLKASIFWHSAIIMTQLSHCYMTTGKMIALTRWTFVGKIMSLLSNMLSRFVIAFLPKTKSLLISWLQSLSAVIIEPKKIKCHCFHFFPHLFAMKWCLPLNIYPCSGLVFGVHRRVQYNSFHTANISDSCPIISPLLQVWHFHISQTSLWMAPSWQPFSTCFLVCQSPSMHGYSHLNLWNIEEDVVWHCY